MSAFREHGDNDGKNECHSVWGDGEQLGLGGGVSELLDDGGLGGGQATMYRK